MEVGRVRVRVSRATGYFFLHEYIGNLYIQTVRVRVRVRVRVLGSRVRATGWGYD
jgi:hypothetical protein